MTLPEPVSELELRQRLAQAEETLAAISRGEVDALMVTVDGGLRVYTLEGADAFYRALVEQMPEGAAAVSAAGQVLYANSTFARMLGVALEHVIGTQLASFVDVAHQTRVARLLAASTPSDAIDVLLLAAHGRSVPAALSVRPVDGHAEGARCVVVVDLTRRQEAERAVREAEARFRSAFANAPIGMALLDATGLLQQVNPAFVELAGADEDTLRGTPLPWLADAGDAQATLAPLLSGTAETATVHREAVHPDGSTRHVALHLTVLPSAEGQAPALIAQVQDESDRRRHETQLRYVADHDELSGLLNRRGFDEALTRHITLANRYGASGALLLIDVDHFKHINDTYGHSVGDTVLRELSQQFGLRLRESDVLARLGGDEFAVLLPRASPAEAVQAAQQLLLAARTVDLQALGPARRLTVSIGIAALTGSHSEAGELLARADVAMYDAKEAGRDRCRSDAGAADGSSTTASRLGWVARIEDALAHGTLSLAAQPLVDLATGETVQHELLVRLPGEGDGEDVAAAQWFPVAERHGLAPAIDEWVVRQAVGLLVEDVFPAVNVNVSATSLGRSAWRAGLEAQLAGARSLAGRLTFEITETAAIGNLAAASALTAELRAAGCRLAMDDFGAGFGSFYYLKHLPFDDIKIDGEFVRDSAGNPHDLAIIEATVLIASRTGRRTVAECVEDAATLDLVRSLGVDLAQGYHLGRPQRAPLPT